MKTKKPTGLTITRDNNKYIFKWKIADDNYSSGQSLQYRIKHQSGSWSKWETLSVTASATSRAVTISKANYQPTTTATLTGVEFRICGKKAPYSTDSGTITPDWSDWSNKTMDIKKPKAPSVTSALQSNWNETKFTWNIPSKDDDAYIFSSYQWQSVLIKDSNVSDGSKVKWSTSNAGWLTGTGSSTSYSRTITENTTTITNKSYTRWFRIRSRGVAGNSDWKYSKHVYSKPYNAVLESAKVTKKTTYYNVELTWKAPSSASHPIDQTISQYAIGIPTANMQPPVNPSWSNGQISKDTTKTDKSAFQIDQLLTDDQCIFARVVTQHDAMQGISNVKLVAKGRLAQPSGLSVTLNGTTATVTATNNSTASPYSGSDSTIKRNFLLVKYKGKKKNTKGINVGIIPYGQTSANVTIPDQTGETAYSIGVVAVVGTYTSSLASDGTTRYTVKSDMTSNTLWSTADVPVAPANLQAEYNGNILATWEWSWDDAEGIEISWSKDPDAWDSTEEPETYETEEHKEKLYIKNVDAGAVYYIRARFKAGDDFSPYSDIVTVDTTLPPEKPILSLSDGVIGEQGKTTVSWIYASPDGTEQAYAEAIVNNTVIGHSQSEKHITLYAEDLGWVGGNNYDITVRVQSSSGSFSEYSDIATVYVAEPLVCEISSTSLTNITITDDTSSTRSVLSLTEMPLSITVTGAGIGGMTEVAIERAEQYSINRPDDDYFNGYEGETVYLNRHIGEEAFTVNLDNCIGRFDDGAKYRIVASISDSVGEASATLGFEVHWSHQAVKPQGQVTLEGLNAKIKPIAPTGTATGDYCDIYRLSKDKPSLVFPNAVFGTTYLDPYPAIGGGYRLVFNTKNGDYITTDGKPSWLDLDSGFVHNKAIIDFGSDSVELYYNVDSNHTWNKDFTETQYLGGSVQGDWNPAVSRKLDMNAITLNSLEEDTIKALRRLAVYHGLCNVRTLDGSSFHANVDVTESNSHERYGMISEFSLTVTRVDSEGYDGVEYSVLEG